MNQTFVRQSGRRAFDNCTRYKMMKKLIDALLLHIKAFDGDIFGGTIRDYRVRGTVHIKDINCRIDHTLLHVFIQSLHPYFEVDEVVVELGGSFADYIKKIRVTLKNDNYDNRCYTYVSIVVMPRLEWMRLPCDFDVNLLAENANSRFVRYPCLMLNRYTDKLNHVVERIQSNTFCSLETCYNKTPEQIKTLIDTASGLVSRGWIMDDALFGDRTWVVSSWHLITNGLRMVRKGFDNHQCDKMFASKECSICNEEFKSTDILINTKCNHNFHWNEFSTNSHSAASRSSRQSVCCKGLKEWVNRGNITCPICRQVMF